VRGAIGISVAFHLTLVTAAWTGLPVLFEDTIQEESPIIVELVTIAEKTRAAPEAVRREAPEPAKPRPAKAELKLLPPPPAAKPVPPAPEKVAALRPLPTLEPKLKAVEPPPPPPETRAAPEPPKPQPSRVNVRPRTKPEPPAKTPKFDASRISVLIDKTRKEEPPAAEPEESKTFLQPPPIPESPVRRAAIGNQLTVSEVDAIKYQIEQCWNVPAGARDARDLVIKIRISLKPDGSLKQQPVILGRDRMDDGFFRTAAESARRAVQRCTPLKNLPTSKYDRWQDITLTFNPQEMLGG
jgi:hypothetical protein